MNNIARFVKEITVKDPDGGTQILELFKDGKSGKMFAIETLHMDSITKGKTISIPNPVGSGKLIIKNY